MKAKEGPFCLASLRSGPGVECTSLSLGPLESLQTEGIALWSSGGQLEVKGRLTVCAITWEAVAIFTSFLRAGFLFQMIK